ncbi:MAG: hypothetical protein ACJ76Y_21105 [Thermoanaerobaculia bacterium]
MITFTVALRVREERGSTAEWHDNKEKVMKVKANVKAGGIMLGD